MSTFTVFLCAWCKRYSMDFENYDKNNTQVIYNASAGAKELPSVYTLGEYRGTNNEYRSSVMSDMVFANPAALGTYNQGFTMTPTKKEETTEISDDFVLQNNAFQEHSP